LKSRLTNVENGIDAQPSEPRDARSGEADRVQAADFSIFNFQFSIDWQ
jgi:hypothetical protein